MVGRVAFRVETRLRQCSSRLHLHRTCWACEIDVCVDCRDYDAAAGWRLDRAKPMAALAKRW